MQQGADGFPASALTTSFILLFTVGTTSVRKPLGKESKIVIDKLKRAEMKNSKIDYYYKEYEKQEKEQKKIEKEKEEREKEQEKERKRIEKERRREEKRERYLEWNRQDLEGGKEYARRRWRIVIVFLIIGIIISIIRYMIDPEPWERSFANTKKNYYEKYGNK